MARAVAWYRDVLGLPVSEHAAFEVETPNVTLAFWMPEEQREPFVPHENGIALRVAHVETAVEEDRAARAEVIGIVLILHRRVRAARIGPLAPRMNRPTNGEAASLARRPPPALRAPRARRTSSRREARRSAS